MRLHAAPTFFLHAAQSKISAGKQRIEDKRAKLASLVGYYARLSAVMQQNRALAEQPPADERLHVPFLLVHTPHSTSIKCEVRAQRGSFPAGKHDRAPRS